MIEDFLGGLLRECKELGQAWRRRHPPGLDRVLARLSGWSLLARSLPPRLDGPNGPDLDLDQATWRRLWSMARGLKVLAEIPVIPAPELVPELIERLHGVMISRFDPADAFLDHHSRIVVTEWAQRHAAAEAIDAAHAGAAALEFIALSPLSWGNAEMAVMLAALMAAGREGPLVLPLTPAEMGEDGYARALAAGLDGDQGAWIAYWLAQTRIVLKRLPDLADGAERLRTRWIKLLSKAPFGERGAELLADTIIALPVITPTFLEDSRIATDLLRDGMVLLFAADDAVEVGLPGSLTATIMPPALRLLAR
ncbi:hypothetical protein [Magnetospirillum moscoviense]|uniref:Uncharacterized protein n=1 Tax=Magnetospirillum moscoviense TaxID=1437059 RepID=A0A178MW56_9PROT|nr:hypothetical protein [Magnetospirillum moscoviense]MBF0327059.1 hypothetical protein [Alphaproteobacteria bacterium]OAN53210.1 hypothetical protein A6A05_09685 [Magnetospirillum moscoviense]